MLQSFLDLDESIFLGINYLHFPWLDKVMIFWSEKWVWIPLYLFLVYLIYVSHGKKITLLALIIIVVGITISDQTASGLLKPMVQRLRPCQNPEFDHIIYLANGCGGKYGFPSSHASNSMFATVFCMLLIRPGNFLKFVLMAWLFLMGWSRIYLAAHYPSDILGGWIIGALVAWLGYIAIRQAGINKNGLTLK